MRFSQRLVWPNYPSAKLPHFASVNLDDEEFKKLEQVIKGYLRTTRPNFLAALVLAFSQQYQAGEIPDWPPRFVVRPDIKDKKKKAGPRIRPAQKAEKPVKPRKRPGSK